MPAESAGDAKPRVHASTRHACVLFAAGAAARRVAGQGAETCAAGCSLWQMYTMCAADMKTFHEISKGGIEPIGILFSELAGEPEYVPATCASRRRIPMPLMVTVSSTGSDTKQGAAGVATAGEYGRTTDVPPGRVSRQVPAMRFR